MRLPDLEAWAIFASVVEHRSLSAAAAAIGLSKATVSKAVARLEAQLGQSLFHRTSRRLSLTEAGKPLADRARRLLAEAHAAEEAARAGASSPEGRIRLAAPMSFGVTHLAPLLAAFLAAHPKVQIELHLSDAQVDIVAEGIDVALRIGVLADSSLRARRLSEVTIHVVAAPTYLASHGVPAHPAELGDHVLLGYAYSSGPWRFTRPRPDGSDEEVAVRTDGPLSANSGDALMPALIAGLGIAILPDFIVDAAIGAGTLVPILTDWVTIRPALHLLTPPSPLRPARVEALIAFLAERLR